MSRIVYVNGDYVPEEDARISIFDRATLFEHKSNVRGSLHHSTSRGEVAP